MTQLLNAYQMNCPASLLQKGKVKIFFALLSKTLKNLCNGLLHFMYLFHDVSDRKRGKKADKVGKGLRHFSMKVCEKVQIKGVTTYNEVADELVAEFSDPRTVLLSPSDPVTVS